MAQIFTCIPCKIFIGIEKDNPFTRRIGKCRIARRGEIIFPWNMI